MNRSIRRNIATACILAAVSLTAATAALAQSSVTTDGTATVTKAEKRASNKQARKQNRAAKNAELAKLEKNGYNSASDDASYPDKLQAAQKKAGG